MIVEFHGKKPKISRNVFIAPNAIVVGDVILEEGVSIWYGAILRGDIEPIIVKKFSNIQDNCVVHTSKGYPVTIGEYVTVGHKSVIHGCEIGDRVLIGMNATVLDGSKIDSGCIVAAGSVVREKSYVKPFSMVAGVPAQFKKQLDENVLTKLEEHAKSYFELSREYTEFL
ncbi:MAG: gamma carbonic anhydrase family protein [Thermotogae bacterium]|nr:gamma carbonic anhydrase family protein [Thermotogota bacterium]